jgi:SH3 domain protein
MLKRIILLSAFSLISHFSAAQSTEQLPLVSSSDNVDEPAPGDSGFIVDNLFIYAHSGPGKNYRILGSIDAGTQIRIIAQPQNGYIQIIDDKEREVWVEEKFISKQSGLKQQLSAANEMLATLQSELNNVQNQLPQLQQSNEDLQSENTRLQDSITDLQSQLATQRQQSATKKQYEQHKLLAYGGGIAFTGLFLGIILTISLSRRKRYDGWA